MTRKSFFGSIAARLAAALGVIAVNAVGSADEQGEADAISRLEAQLGACGTAALGWAKEPVEKNAWGWSPAFEDVLTLRKRHDMLLELAERRFGRYTVRSIKPHDQGGHHYYMTVIAEKTFCPGDQVTVDGVPATIETMPRRLLCWDGPIADVKRVFPGELRT